MYAYKISCNVTRVYDKRNTLQSAFTDYILLPIIALKYKYVYYNRNDILNILGFLHTWHSISSYRKGLNIRGSLAHVVRIRTIANYRLARKSSSRGPNAAFTRVTEIRKNFYTL